MATTIKARIVKTPVRRVPVDLFDMEPQGGVPLLPHMLRVTDAGMDDEQNEREAWLDRVSYTRDVARLYSW